MIEDHNGLPPPVAGTGLDITSEECRAILDVLSDLRQGWNGSKSLPFARQNGESYHLPTKTLVLEGVYFHDPDFLPLLFREMPDLRHIELQARKGRGSEMEGREIICVNEEIGIDYKF